MLFAMCARFVFLTVVMQAASSFNPSSYAPSFQARTTRQRKEGHIPPSASSVSAPGIHHHRHHHHPRPFCRNSSSTGTSTSSELCMWFPNEGMEVARGTFGWWIMGAAGSGGAARSAFPKLMDDFKELQALKGVGTTLGGTKVGLSYTLLGYPEDVCLQDIEMVINNPMDIAEIPQAYPVEGNFLAAKGYLTLDAFKLANAGANPLAVRAVFDSFGKPKTVEPTVAQAIIDEYKEDPMKIKERLLLSRLSVISAAATLLFLLGLADFASATDLYRGWFPDWPGGQDFPRNLLSPEGNIFTIGDYFIWDIPPDRMD